MRALVCRQYGPPSSLRVEDVAAPKAGAGEVVVSVKAAGVNFPDLLMIQNKYQHKPPLPFSPGYEIAGVVKEIGEGVTGIAPGDTGVAMIRWGGFAEEAVIEASRFWPVPAGVDFASAAAFPLAYGTSYHALKDRGLLKTGETLLVLGASGGVGLAAVQLGKLMGARVIACASSAEKLEVCRNLGADELIDYAKPDWRAELTRVSARGVDVTLDPVGGAFSEAAVRSMAWGGRHLVVGFAAGEIPKLPLNLPLLKGCAIVGVAWDSYGRRDPEGARAIIAQLTAWIADGKLKPALAATYPLEEAAMALEHLAQRKIQGKAVVVIRKKPGPP
jgi:NADPH2:quinone reductase